MSEPISASKNMARVPVKRLQVRPRYNPNSEKGDLEQATASNWELLRRVPAFQTVARQWIDSEEFRFKHVEEKKVYKDNNVARCALDWMLTPKQRYALAQFQMRHRLFFWQQGDNYGPIIVEPRLGRLAGGIGHCIDDLFQVSPDPNPGGTLRLEQPWPDTPEKFRAQLIAIFDPGNLREIVLEDYANYLLRIGNYLAAGKQLSAEEQLMLGRYLFQLGDHFNRISQNYKISAIRRRKVYSEPLIDEILLQIKQAFPYEPATGRDQTSKRSFLGTHDQWDKFLAWEASDGNAYLAAGEFLPKDLRDGAKSKRLPGDLSRSERQRDAAASIRTAVKAIQSWLPKLYPVRELI